MPLSPAPALADQPLTVTSVITLNDISVTNGTSLGSVPFPATVSVNLSDTNTTTATVSWDNGSPVYNGNTAGTYVFTGTLTLPAGVTNPNNVTATVNVIVASPINETLTVRNPSTTGFTVSLNPALNGLTSSGFVLKDDQNNAVTITSAATTGGATYSIGAALTAGKTYTVT